MKNLIFFMSALLLFALSSCGETLDIIDWIDRAKDECRPTNTTGEMCTAVKCEIKVREGKIQAVYPWALTSEEFYEGECNEVFRCVRQYLEGKKVNERSGSYEHSIVIMPARE